MEFSVLLGIIRMTAGYSQLGVVGQMNGLVIGPVVRMAKSSSGETILHGGWPGVGSIIVKPGSMAGSVKIVFNHHQQPGFTECLGL